MREEKRVPKEKKKKKESWKLKMWVFYKKKLKIIEEKIKALKYYCNVLKWGWFRESINPRLGNNPWKQFSTEREGVIKETRNRNEERETNLDSKRGFCLVAIKKIQYGFKKGGKKKEAALIKRMLVVWFSC